ncbi:YqiA/YcfP family alpha/beta fold hydrolase [Methylobacillus flagellatus]|uniref:YqiA/YcfP family alpha/beta fold hydrolase n=1 Tax=Methylobacillus flagellatus TaxID=405 RepID=UPI0010F87628|nr:YqiA/YcfP family alpha/beta fold hydrolase [Methylobacillus flagellatus]
MHALIYLPGFNSGPQSEKSQQLQQAFPGLQVASYDSWHPQQAYLQLDALIQAAEDPVLIGSSLGGFWAYQFASRLGLRCVLLNPCMHPERSLRYAVGKVTHYYSGETGVMTDADLDQYPSYRVAPHPRFDPMQHCTVLHEQGDETIPCQESVDNFSGRARLMLIEGGHHRFARLDIAISEIRASCASR